MQLDRTVQVFGSREIPAQDASGRPLFRDFAAHPALGAMLPPGGRVALQWVDGVEHQIVTQRVELDTIVLLLRGAARLSDGRRLQEGDAVTVPAGGAYRLTALHPKGWRRW